MTTQRRVTSTVERPRSFAGSVTILIVTRPGARTKSSFQRDMGSRANRAHGSGDQKIGSPSGSSMLKAHTSGCLRRRVSLARV